MSDGLQALSAQMRPVDALSAAGLGQLAGLVIPLQGVLDRLAGNASAVHSFVDAWNSVAQRIGQIQQQLGQSVMTGTAEWRGASADKYRQRADDFAKSLTQFAAAAAAAANTAKTTAEAVAAGRSSANDLITDLVQRLISLVRQLMAAEGGMTPTVLAQAGQLVSSFAKPVATVERQVGATVSNVAKPLGDLLAIVNAMTRLWDSYAGNPDQAQLIRTSTASAMGAKAFSDPKTNFHGPREPEHLAHELAHVVQQRAGVAGVETARPVQAQPAKTRGLVAHELAHPVQQTPAPPPSDEPPKPKTRGLLAHEQAHTVQQGSGRKP
jgi:hypothetical protein